jgi:hypothetical protein
VGIQTIPGNQDRLRPDPKAKPDPGYICARNTREDTRVSVETNVYATSKPDGDLVWTGVSDSFKSRVQRRSPMAC